MFYRYLVWNCKIITFSFSHFFEWFIFSLIKLSHILNFISFIWKNYILTDQWYITESTTMSSTWKFWSRLYLASKKLVKWLCVEIRLYITGTAVSIKWSYIKWFYSCYNIFFDVHILITLRFWNIYLNL